MCLLGGCQGILGDCYVVFRVFWEAAIQLLGGYSGVFGGCCVLLVCF